MPHGQRDWSNVGAEQTVSGLADMAELAARLGSPVTFNREGNVLFLSSFEHGLIGWSSFTGGTGAEAIASAAWSRTSGYSCKLVSGSAYPGNTWISRTFPYPVLGKYGVELSFVLDADLDLLDVFFWIYDGTYLTIYTLRYDPDTDVVQVRTTAGAYTTVVTGVALAAAIFTFHTVKLVVDADNRQYERLILNSAEYDLTAHPGYVTANTATSQMQAGVKNTGASGENAVVYVDDLILTQNEP